MSFDPQVKVEGGILEGYICENEADYGKRYFSFQGIPYAKPPLGELRFKAPQPVEPWEGIKNVKEDGSPCYSKDMMNPKEKSGSEDCLYLNVYTPKLPIKCDNEYSYDLKPTMVFIHGGAFTSGSNSKFIYGPDYLLREDVVLVSINYRLGLLGFLHLDDKTLGVPGNAGLKDMVLALRWVQNNIKHFNGDPDNVTIFGESAGAAAVHLLVLSPMAKGLFHKAIAQSGSALNLWSECDNVSKRIAKALNMEETNEKALLQKLREIKVEKLFAIQETFSDPWDVSIRRFVGYVEEDPNQDEEPFMTEHPMKILTRGNYNHVPLILGFNSREGMLVHINDKKLHNQLVPTVENNVPVNFCIKKGTLLSKQIGQRIHEYYFGKQDPEKADIDLSYKLWSDNFFIRDIYKSLRKQAKTSSRSLYLYQMTVETSLNLFKQLSGIKSPGVSHADDLFYLFKTPLTGDIEADSPEDIAVRRFCRLWTNFAKFGNPNSAHDDPLLSVFWRPFTNSEKNYLEIGQDLICKKDPLTERMAFWDDLHIHVNCTNSKL